VFGGVDMTLLVANYLNSLLLLVTVGSVCMLVSAIAETVTGAVLTSYVLALLAGTCLLGVLGGNRSLFLQIPDVAVAQGQSFHAALWDNFGRMAVLHMFICVPCWMIGVSSLRSRMGDVVMRASELPPRELESVARGWKVE